MQMIKILITTFPKTDYLQRKVNGTLVNIIKDAL